VVNISFDQAGAFFEPDAGAAAALAFSLSAASTIFNFKAAGRRAAAGRVLRMVLRFMNSSPVKNVEIRVFQIVLRQPQCL
jgi:hypothetical protein